MKLSDIQRKEQEQTQIKVINNLRTYLRQITLNILKEVQQGRTDLTVAIRSKDKQILETLATGTTYAYLKGMERSKKIVEHKIPKTLSIPSAIEVSKKRLEQPEHVVPRIKSLYLKRFKLESEKIYQEVEERLNKAITTSIQQGEHIKAGVARVRQALTESGLAFDKPFLYESLFRTESAMAYNGGRWIYNQDSSVQTILWGYEYSCVSDSRSREEHIALDGFKAPKDDPIWNRIMPPNGYNCRCTVIEVFNDDPINMRTKDERIIPEIDNRFAFNPALIVGLG